MQSEIEADRTTIDSRETRAPTPSLPDKKLEDDAHPAGEDMIFVDWDGPDDPANPLNWTYKKKWISTIIVSLFTFISPVSSSMVAPASETIAEQFHITNEAIVAMTTSIFILGYAIGPLLLGPLSELYGRSRVLQIANMWYLAWNIGCSFAQSEGQLIAFRLLAGLGGSAPLSVGGGTLADMWRPEERGRAIAIYSLAPLLGPVLGPICGAWIAERSTWRWVYWATSIVDAAIQVAGLFLLRETYAPFLLEQKAKRMRQNMDVEKARVQTILTVYEKNGSRTWQEIFAQAMTRPFALLAREPIIQLVSLYLAFIYGLLYLFLTSMPNIFMGVYHESLGISGLHYIALGIGLTLASQINARMLDKIYIYFKNRNGGVGEPEFRLPSTIVGAVLLPIGLFISGWAAQAHVHWAVTDLGIMFVGAGIILVFQSTQTYVIDAFTLYAASALACVACFRSLAGFGFPLFAPAMYNALGYGKGNTILACISIALGWPAPCLFWIYGKRIRASSRFARKSN
ncbi:MFS polyamine transporter [Amanita rubescens]|nr:MFS polyamine transporter [Amanita rubescens]KAF8345230.1 MFS polyamine transporter [Amanita rubescens]